MALVGDPQGTVWVELHKGVSVETDRFQDGKLTTAYTWPGGFVVQPVFPMLASRRKLWPSMSAIPRTRRTLLSPRRAAASGSLTNRTISSRT